MSDEQSPDTVELKENLELQGQELQALQEFAEDLYVESEEPNHGDKESDIPLLDPYESEHDENHHRQLIKFQGSQSLPPAMQVVLERHIQSAEPTRHSLSIVRELESDTSFKEQEFTHNLNKDAALQRAFEVTSMEWPIKISESVASKPETVENHTIQANPPVHVPQPIVIDTEDQSDLVEDKAEQEQNGSSFFGNLFNLIFGEDSSDQPQQSEQAPQVESESQTTPTQQTVSSEAADTVETLEEQPEPAKEQDQPQSPSQELTSQEALLPDPINQNPDSDSGSGSGPQGLTTKNVVANLFNVLIGNELSHKSSTVETQNTDVQERQIESELANMGDEIYETNSKIDDYGAFFKGLISSEQAAPVQMDMQNIKAKTSNGEINSDNGSNPSETESLPKGTLDGLLENLNSPSNNDHVQADAFSDLVSTEPLVTPMTTVDVPFEDYFTDL